MKFVLKNKYREEEVKKLSEECNIDYVLSSLLLSRNIKSKEEVQSFLEPKFKNLSSPYGMLNMDAVVDRIRLATSRKENITIYGDYDCDGICATTELFITLKKNGRYGVTLYS